MTSLAFLIEKPHLEALHVRENKIANLDGLYSGLESLSYINLRENQIAEFSEIDKLNVLPKLKKLTLTGKWNLVLFLVTNGFFSTIIECIFFQCQLQILIYEV